MNKYVSVCEDEINTLEHTLTRTRTVEEAELLESQLFNKQNKESPKLGTVKGVYIPVVLAIWGVIYFLRLGYVVGQAGLIGTLAMFSCGYLITTVTSLSISAISTNGKVRGGGPYYMISRTLGPEFGGSVGLVIYFGTLLNGVLNALAFTEAFVNAFGLTDGSLIKLLPQSYFHQVMYSSLLLFSFTMLSLSGSKIYANVSLILGIFVTVSTFSVILTFLFKQPFVVPERDIYYSSFKLKTLYENLWPDFRIGTTTDSIESFRTMFGLLFPACIGIMAGASMSGDLKTPSKSIPSGTLYGVFSTFVLYILSTILLAFTTRRASLLKNLNIVTEIGLSPSLIAFGVLATTISSVYASIVSSSKILQAIARDNIIPILKPFSQKREMDNPVVAIFFTYVISQIALLIGNINSIASVVSMFFILSFLITNFACFILRVSSAPNFRPSFKYFKWWTAFLGIVISSLAMFYVDTIYASIALVFSIVMFSFIHFVAPPKAWGDVTQSLIYHQVRKYLLRLDSRKTHVKFWRPQILLLANSPRNSYQIISFCNSLKKGSLFVVGHVVKGDFETKIQEINEKQNRWLDFIDSTKFKAFFQISISSNERIGTQNLLLGSGIGGMVPNIVIMKSYNIEKEDPEFSRILGPLPTDNIKYEKGMSVSDYVGIMEDVISCKKTLALAYGFSNQRINGCMPFEYSGSEDKKFIDLWPIQISDPDSQSTKESKITNFDTYTMVLQLGCILHMTKPWKNRHTLRVCCFVEKIAQHNKEHKKVRSLLDKLRIPAELQIFCLENSNLETLRKINAANNRNSTSSISMRNLLSNSSTTAQNNQGSLSINMPLTYDSCEEDSDSTSYSDEFQSNFGRLSLEFNNLSCKIQYKIVNELICSKSKDSKFIFTTLSLPQKDTSKSLSASKEYIENLETLVKNFPPTILIHSKSMSVTATL